ncbi:MAG TPA: hypothetical protein VFN88_02255 [Caulobacteraceae bacterium]|nr:hypothetical protein [Caulobacteraceae bacterium]
MQADSVHITRPRRTLSARELRRTLESAVERLLAAVEAAVAQLDALDGDADLEPSLGFLERPCSWANASGDQRDIVQGANDEREEVCEDEGAACEDEGFESDREPEDAQATCMTWSATQFVGVRP